MSKLKKGETGKYNMKKPRNFYNKSFEDAWDDCYSLGCKMLDDIQKDLREQKENHKKLDEAIAMILS